MLSFACLLGDGFAPNVFAGALLLWPEFRKQAAHAARRDDDSLE